MQPRSNTISHNRFIITLCPGRSRPPQPSPAHQTRVHPAQQGSIDARLAEEIKVARRQSQPGRRRQGKDGDAADQAQGALTVQRRVGASWLLAFDDALVRRDGTGERFPGR